MPKKFEYVVFINTEQGEKPVARIPDLKSVSPKGAKRIAENMLRKLYHNDGRIERVKRGKP